MAEAKPGILRNLRVKRLALVDIGANLDRDTGDGAHIMLFKRAVDKGGPNLAQVHVDTTDERDEYEKATLDAESRNKLPDSAFAAVWTDAQGKKHRKLPIHDAGHLAAARGRVDGASIPENVKAEAQHKIDAATKHQSKEKSVKKSLLMKMLGLFTETDEVKKKALLAEINKDAADGDCDDMATEKAAKDAKDKKDKEEKDAKDKAEMEKAGAPALIAKLAAAEARAEAAEGTAKQAMEIAKAMREDSDRREMRDVLKSFRATPFDLKDDKDVVKYLALKRASPEAFDTTMSLLKSQDSQLAESALYKNFGTTRTGEGSAWAQIEAKVDSAIEKSAGKMTHEQAVEKVLLANPKLARQYRAEQQ